MKHKFLTKNTKITINEVKPNGLKTAEKVYDEDGKINKKSLKDFSKKLSDYYNFDEDEFIEPKMDRSQDETEPWDVYDTEALGAGKMYGLKYDNEDTDAYDSFEERNDKLNDTSDYDDLFGTHDGFGETKDKNNTYERLKDSSKKYKEYKYDLPTEYQKTPRVRVTKGVNENKMKRLNFKTEFKSDADMVELIPENYKKDGHTFLMSDGNQLYKVRWDTALNEGSILGYKNKSMIVESRNKMKKLYNYKYSDSMGKTNDYITEGDAMRKMMDMVKGKSSLNEQEADTEVDPFDAEANDAHNANITKTASDKIAADKTAEENKPKAKLHYLEKGYSIGGQEVLFKYPTMKLGNEITDNANAPMVVRGNNNTILVDRETHKIKNGSIVDTFKNLKVTSSPNGSMSTAYADFMGYVVSQKMTSQTTFASKSKTSQYTKDCTTIDQCVWVTPQYRRLKPIVIRLDVEAIKIWNHAKKEQTQEPIMPVEVTYTPVVNGNGVLVKNEITKIQWVYIDKNGKKHTPTADGTTSIGVKQNTVFTGQNPVKSTDGSGLTFDRMRNLMELLRAKVEKVETIDNFK